MPVSKGLYWVTYVMYISLNLFEFSHYMDNVQVNYIAEYKHSTKPLARWLLRYHSYFSLNLLQLRQVFSLSRTMEASLLRR